MSERPFVPSRLLNASDDVITLLASCDVGDTLVTENGLKVTAIETVPAGHKVAVRSLLSGTIVKKAGTAIGQATCNIAAGAWVHTHNLAGLRPVVPRNRIQARRLHPPSAPEPKGAYVPGLVSEPWVFTSGQGPFDPKTGAVLGQNITEQTHATMANIGAVLAAGGCTFADIVSITAHLANIADCPTFDSIYREYFQGDLPPRTTVGAQLLGALVEVTAIARRPAD